MTSSTAHPARRGAPLDDTQLVRLAYELLDAHDDTARLAAAGPPVGDRDWRLHLRYLRDLQRVGRELLARAAAAS